LFCKNSLININEICVFALVFNTCIKDSTISAIKNIKYALIYINLFATNKDNNNKKKQFLFAQLLL